MKKYTFTIFAILISGVIMSQNKTDNWVTIDTKYADMSGILHAPAPDTLFIHRMDGVLLRSFNGGYKWDSLFIRHDSTRFTDIGSFFLNGKIGFTWGIWGCLYTGIKQERPILLKTINSGLSWEPMMNGLTENDVNNISLVHFWDKENGFAVASHNSTDRTHHNNHVYITSNGGSTWHDGSYPFYPVLNYSPRMVSFSDKYNGVMCGTEIDFNLSITDNSAYNWQNTNIHKFGYNPTGIYTFDNNNGFIVSNDSIYTTHSGFVNFDKRKLPFINYNNSVLTNNTAFYTYDEKTTYFLTFDDHIYKTTDGFNSYNISKVKDGKAHYSIAGYKNNVYLYGVNGQIYKTTIGQITTLSATSNEINIQVYPNPATGNSINISSNTLIESYQLHNILGELIQKNELNSPEINILNLKPGTYFLSLFNTQKGLIGSKKVIKQ